MAGLLGRAEELLALARSAIASAAPDEGLRLATDAYVYAILEGASVIAARACVVASHAAGYMDELEAARQWAARAEEHARAAEPHGEDHMRALCQLFETWEISGFLVPAALAFIDLEASLPHARGWASDVRSNAANHLLSLATKLHEPELADLGLRQGVRAVDLAGDLDERSALAQWASVYAITVGDPALARELLEASFACRAKTRKRDITKHFPLAHLLWAEGRIEDALSTVSIGIARASEHGLARYVRAGRTMQGRILATES